MTRMVLEVEGVSKSFLLGGAKASEETLLNQVVASSGRMLKRIRQGADLAEREKQLHWALRDVNLSVAEGEVVSVIGHNGSGKSTLLKILSRITAPTSGRVRVRGRLASLLEVGTGFHPDLSGRDNVYLNAAILGMKREEIRRRFDDIVQFAGIEAFIDTPVKNYSSGMKVRLGFSVAAQLDPDVLLIDEVLAVGDASFQQRCLNRIEEFGTSGRTILYVSHHLPSVARLSKRTIVLDHGKVLFEGPTLSAIRQYEEQIGGYISSRNWSEDAAPGDKCARLLSLQLTANDLPVSGPIDLRFPITLKLRYLVLSSGLSILPSLHLHDFTGTPLLTSIDNHPDWHGRPRPAGVYETSVVLPGNFLNEGSFQIAVSICSMHPVRCHVHEKNVLAFSTFDPVATDSSRGEYLGNIRGYFRPVLDWKTGPA